MKKFICLIVIFLMVGCATTTYTETRPDGVQIAVSIKRPLFASTAVAWSANTGNINSASSVDLQQLVASMLAGYLASQTAGSTSAVPAVAK